MSKQKGHDYSTILIWAAALVTVVRYIAAFIASDMGQITGKLSDVITFMMGVSGFGMGILDVIGGTYLFDGWRRAMPQTGKAWSSRFKVLTFFVFALICAGVHLLAMHLATLQAIHGGATALDAETALRVLGVGLALRGVGAVEALLTRPSPGLGWSRAAHVAEPLRDRGDAERLEVLGVRGAAFVALVPSEGLVADPAPLPLPAGVFMQDGHFVGDVPVAASEVFCVAHSMQSGTCKRRALASSNVGVRRWPMGKRSVCSQDRKCRSA